MPATSTIPFYPWCRSSVSCAESHCTPATKLQVSARYFHHYSRHRNYEAACCGSCGCSAGRSSLAQESMCSMCACAARPAQSTDTEPSCIIRINMFQYIAHILSSIRDQLHLVCLAGNLRLLGPWRRPMSIGSHMTRVIIISGCPQVIGCAADGHDKHDRTKASADVSATKFTVTPISCSGALRSPTTDTYLQYDAGCGTATRRCTYSGDSRSRPAVRHAASSGLQSGTSTESTMQGCKRSTKDAVACAPPQVVRRQCTNRWPYQTTAVAASGCLPSTWHTLHCLLHLRHSTAPADTSCLLLPRLRQRPLQPGPREQRATARCESLAAAACSAMAAQHKASVAVGDD